MKGSANLWSCFFVALSGVTSVADVTRNREFRAWSSPQWGFTDSTAIGAPRALAKSLVFDQPFDEGRVRPFPLVANPSNPDLKVAERPTRRLIPEESKQLAQIVLPRTQPQRLRRSKAAAPYEVGAFARAVETFLPMTLKLASQQSIPSWDEWVERKARQVIERKARQVIERKARQVIERKAREVLEQNAREVTQAETLKSLPEIHTPDSMEPTKKPNPPTESSVAAAAPAASSSHSASLNHSSGHGSEWTDINPSRLKNKEEARVVVLDEEAFFSGKLVALRGASVQWLSRQSKLWTETNSKGFARSPYPFDQSIRFSVQMDGFLPAVGFANRGFVTPVFLVRKDRWISIARSLSLNPTPDQPTALIKVLDKNWKPLSQVQLENSFRSARSYYAAGAFGIFHPGAKESGPLGDILVSPLPMGLTYWMPSVKDSNGIRRESPAQSWDTSSSPILFSTTLVDGVSQKQEAVVVDAISLETPEANVFATVGGQRGLITMTSEGILSFENLFQRNAVDLIEVRASGYLPLWVNTTGFASTLPDTLYLFQQQHVDTVLKPVIAEVPFQRGVVFGNLRPEVFSRSVQISVFEASGRKSKEARLFYFDSNNRIQPTASGTHPENQNFVVVGLRPGEYHLLASHLSAKGQREGLGTTIIRVQDNTITQLQF